MVFIFGLILFPKEDLENKFNKLNKDEILLKNKSAFFTSDENLIKIINNYILKIENNHNQKVQTLVLPFKNFYLAEDYHQDYYKKNPIRYNYYKYSCGREQRIKQLKINLR